MALSMSRYRVSALFVSIGCASACSVLLGEPLVLIHCEAEDGFGAPSCLEGDTCVAGTCRTVGRPPLAACDTDADCRVPAGCVETSSFVPGGQKQCILTCRSSEDCLSPSQGLVCRPLELAATAVCWPAEALPPRVAPGTVPAGAACVSSGECRSGLCHETRCTDVCALDEDCAQSGTVCRVAATPLGASPGWTCAPGSADSARVGRCKLATDCHSGACSLTIEGQTYCAASCCSSRECGPLLSGATGEPTLQLACSKLNGLRACARVVPASASGVVGQACASDDECRSGSCFGEGTSRYCSDLCCDDASCGDVKRFACRSIAIGGSWALRCVAK